VLLTALQTALQTALGLAHLSAHADHLRIDDAPPAHRPSDVMHQIEHAATISDRAG
jgi:hypothetical protein